MYMYVLRLSDRVRVRVCTHEVCHLHPEHSRYCNLYMYYVYLFDPYLIVVVGVGDVVVVDVVGVVVICVEY